MLRYGRYMHEAVNVFYFRIMHSIVDKSITALDVAEKKKPPIRVHFGVVINLIRNVLVMELHGALNNWENACTALTLARNAL